LKSGKGKRYGGTSTQEDLEIDEPWKRNHYKLIELNKILETKFLRRNSRENLLSHKMSKTKIYHKV